MKTYFSCTIQDIVNKLNHVFCALNVPIWQKILLIGGIQHNNSRYCQVTGNIKQTVYIFKELPYKIFQFK